VWPDFTPAIFVWNMMLNGDDGRTAVAARAGEAGHLNVD